MVKVAAVVVLCAALGWATLLWRAADTYSTRVGGFERITLADGSIVELNTSTKVRVSYESAMRRIELVRGEASFDVAHDPSRPFVVSAGETAVRAVGTRFNVRRLAHSVEVLVDEGKVVVSGVAALEQISVPEPALAPIVAAGEGATVNTSGVQLHPSSRDVIARKLAWQNNMIGFAGETLAVAVAEINRYNARQLVIADPAIADIRIGGYFRPTNLDAFVAVLEDKFGVRAVAEDERITLAGAPPE